MPRPTSDLAQKIDGAQGAKKAPPKRERLRSATGAPSWPLTLIAGGPRAATAYQAALASASTLIDRTFWLAWAEQLPDAFGAIPGSRIEIAEHDGTLADFYTALEEIVSIPHGDKRNLLVIDGVSRLWDSVKEHGDVKASELRARGDLDGFKYWDHVNGWWSNFLELVRKHDGPVLLLARLDAFVLSDEGRVIRDERILGHRSLAHEASATIELAEDGSAHVSAPLFPAFVGGIDTPAFTVEEFWRFLGLDSAETVPAQYATPKAATAR